MANERSRPERGGERAGAGRGRQGGDGGARRTGPRQRSAQAPSQRSRSADPSRETAYRVLRAVEEDGAFANLELPQALRRARLGGRDAAFATELTYGTLRRRGFYDAVISQASERAAADIDGAVLDALRLGVHQLLAMRVPPHAAVSATVGLARQVVGQGAGGFVNAVLRRVSERDDAAWTALVAGQHPDEVERLAAVHSHPVWVVRALRAALLSEPGRTPETVGAEMAELLVAHNTPGPLTLAARPGLVDKAELRAAGAEPGPAAATAWTLRGGDPGGIAAVREGRAAVQDAGSQALTLALVDAPLEGPDERWLDLCAGPGGKAGLLAALALERGATLRANEVTPHRAELVRSTLQAVLKTGGQVEVTTGDGRLVGQEEPGRYDRVLVDAPCTGLGALRRRPEARWRRSPADLSTLGPLQRELLGSALDATRPGGLVAYATCSPHLAETQLVVRDVLRHRDDADLVDVRPLVRGRDGEPLVPTGEGAGDAEPWVQLWPHRHGTDGMFVALLRRR